MTLPPFTQHDIEHNYPRGYFSRGHAYFLAGRVQHVAEAEGRVLGVVQGGDETPYECEVRVQARATQPPIFVSTCSCPMGGYCKHTVATLLAWLARDRDVIAAKPSAASTAPPAIIAAPIPRNETAHNASTASAATPDSDDDADVSRELASWLDALKGTASRQAVPAKQQLIYRVSQLHGTIQLAMFSARLLTKGGLGKPTAFRLSRRWGASFLQAGDDEVLNQLAHLSHNDETRFVLEGAYGGVILRALVDTGRCYWDDEDVPLYAGPIRQANLSWQIDPRGIQRIVAQMDEPAAILLPLEPIFYIDDEQCGELTCGMPPKLALRLLAAPPVAPHEIDAVTAALPDELPKPHPLPSGEELAITPRPVLLCRSHRLPDQAFQPLIGWLRDGELDEVSLQFDYDGVRVDFTDKSRTATCWANGRLNKVQRDKAAEAAAFARFSQLGLVEAHTQDRHISASIYSGCYVLPPVSRPPRTVRERINLQHPAADWHALVQTQVPMLREEGWIVEYAQGFYYGLIEPESWHIGLDELDASTSTDWFGVILEVEIAGERRPLLPILLSVLSRYPDSASLRGLSHVQVDTDRGERLSLPVPRIAPLLNTLFDLFADARPNDNTLRLSRLDAARLDELQKAPGLHDLRWRGGAAWLDLAQRLSQFNGLQRVQPPAELEADLRPYQEQGLAWLQFLREYGFGGVLADDMGLGKTVQTLAHLLEEKVQGRLVKPCLIVAPTSLVHNWRRESERFAPSLRLLILHGADRHLLFADLEHVDVAITTYPLLARDVEILATKQFHYLVLDEAQQIKNPKSVTARAVRTLHAEHRLCLTGTPMENHLGELWALFDFLMPGWLGNDKLFNQRWRTPIEKHSDSERRSQLAKRVAPFLLRRTKEQVATELPPKTETIQYVELDGPQRDLYETVRLAMNDRVRAEISRHGVARSQIVILEALLKLRQVCCDPRLVKLDAAKNVASAKLDVLLQMLVELVDEGRRILLFSQFTSMLALIETALNRAGLAYVLLTGDTRDRSTPVERFQAGEVPIFLVSLKAGGVGLNLTAADTVIHYDPWWNPAVENQATDRAYRIGQDKPVFVYKLVAKGTVEEKIVELQRRKAELTAGVLGDEGAALTTLSSADLIQLFAPIE